MSTAKRIPFFDLGRLGFFDMAVGPKPCPADSEFIREVVHLVDWFNLWAHHDNFTEKNEDMDRSAALGSLAKLRRRETDLQMMHAVQDKSLKEFAICPSRLRVLAMGKGSDYSEMLVFLDRLAKRNSHSAISRFAHDDCTEKLCIPANNDTTTTR